MKQKPTWRISHVNLYSKDQPNLVRFYRDLVGLPALQELTDESKWYGFDTPGVTFALEPLTNRKSYTWEYNKDNPVLIQFLAQDEKELEAMNLHLEKNGVKLVRRSEQRSYGKITNFLDPDGNVLEILLPLSQ